MSKEETSSGLLSKVVKFVRNPATNWSDLDNKEASGDEALNKQLLKEMIERKRRNDFVRKREFDMLRKMRKREALVGQDPAGRPSFFQSSMPSKPDDRANTIKKIDEIEAQMSMQWWKTNTPEAGNSSSFPPRQVPAPSQQAGLSAAPPVKTLPISYSATEPSALRLSAQSPPPVLAPLYKSAPISPAAPPRPMVANAPVKAAKIGGLTGVGATAESGSSDFSPSRLTAVDVAEVAHDAELEEASIRFANGDDAGAEAGLLEMLAPGRTRIRNAESWMALFDFYRATAQQEKFEVSAIQFVELFERSAPQWFSMPEMAQQVAVSDPRTGGNGPAADWICPSVVGIQTIATLKAALAKAAMPWRLDWSNLKTIDPVAVAPLASIFSNWSTQPVQLRFIGDAQLQRMLQNATPSGERETPQERWQLRMEALRVTHRPDEFELAALDFCVTYELSPPAWANARCEYKSLDLDGAAVGGSTFIGEAYRDSGVSSMSALEGDTQIEGMNSQAGNLVSVELSGQVHGDAIAVLEQLNAKVMGADIMLISCARLIRVDFSAAGTLLNWVSARQAENRAVQFMEVNRLVAAFFNVIGITEHARVLTRID
jgi:ABC-type transporter Mla MlaB component